MRPTATIPLAALLALLPLVGGHGGAPTMPMEDHDIDERFTLEDAGDAAEVNIFANQDAILSYAVTTDGQPVYFDIHRHDPVTGQVESPVAENRTTGVSGTFNVPAEGDWSVYLLRPEAGPANVRFKLAGYFSLEEIVGFTLSDDDTAPAVPILAVLAAVVALAFTARRR